MAKNKNIIRYILLITAFACGTIIHAQLITDCQKEAKRKSVIKIYTSEIGVREKTNHNDGERVEMYLKAANLKKGNAWCAAFVTWTFKEAGVKTVISGYSPSWFPNDKVIFFNSKGQPPNSGDVFGIWFSSKGRIAHVGFVDKWDDSSYVITVEGNTNEGGSREGDGVYRKRRLKKQIYKVSRWI